MFKVRCKEKFVNDVWELVIGNLYNCKIRDGLYIINITDIFSDGNICKINLTFNEEQFRERYIDICEDRKLKLERINESIL